MHEKKVRQTKEWATTWLIWKVCVPFFILVLLWPMQRWIIGVGDAFERTFAHGDLLVFASLVLIELALDGSHNCPGRFETSIKFRALCESLRALSLLLMVLFAVVKLDVLHNEHGNSLPRFFYYATISTGAALVTVAFSFFFVWDLVRYNAAARVRSLVARSAP